MLKIMGKTLKIFVYLNLCPYDYNIKSWSNEAKNDWLFWLCQGYKPSIGPTAVKILRAGFIPIFECKDMLSNNGIAKMLKCYAHQRETTGSSSDSIQLRPFSKWELLLKLHFMSSSLYTQTKKKRPFFMVLYLSIQLRCWNKKTQNVYQTSGTQKNGNYLILSLYLEGLLNQMCAQFFPLSSGI